MTHCPLCKSQAMFRQPDYGRGIIKVNCPECGHFETHDEAIKHIESSDFGDQRRRDLQVTIKKLNEQNITAEVVVVHEDGIKQIVARNKPQ
jgi:ssDNA-binding Zn-finger/Zn-ribbon topoisomerase 1